MVFSPGTTGEALNWKVMVVPLMISLSAEVPLTVKSLGWTVNGSTAASMATTKLVSCVETVPPQGGWLPITEQGGSLGVGVGLEVAVAVAVAVAVGVGVAAGVEVAVAVGLAVGVGVGLPAGKLNAYTLLSAPK
jgi:hypothetical protein